jgi:hypothetical protein
LLLHVERPTLAGLSAHRLGLEGIAVRFISELGYTVKVGQEEAHQKWVIEDEERIGQAAPAGWKYVGTFATVQSSEKQAGAYRVLFELDSYGALDASAAAAKDTASDWHKVNMEVSKFFDFDWNAPHSNELLKNVVDATIWDPNT